MGISGSKTPLASAEHSSLLETSCYNEESMLEIKRDVAEGFVILLSGGKSGGIKRRSKRDKSNNNNNDDLVAFLAITQGNVIDACFGNMNNRNPESSACRNVKNKIADAAETSNGVRRIAIEAYKNAFEAVVEYHDELDGLNVCSRCVREATLRREAAVSIGEAFEPLVEAIMATT